MIVILAAMPSRNVFAQQVANTNSTPVHMIVTVEPRKGSDVPVVRREDVTVYEGKNPDQVIDWRGDHGGLLIGDGAGSGLDTQLVITNGFDPYCGIGDMADP